MVIPFNGSEYQVKVNDKVRFVNGMFGRTSTGIVTQVAEDYITVKVTEGIFNNCTFKITPDECTIIEKA